MLSLAAFVRRTNPDSTNDLICTTCYRTVVHTADESVLAKAEQDHQFDRQANFYPETEK